MNRIVFTDIDNTLYDWAAFFAPSFRAMTHALVRELALTEDEIYAEFKQVFAENGSLEYSFAIQHLASVRDLPDDKVRNLIRIGRGAFSQVYRKRLRPYPGVLETLIWLRKQGVSVIGVTNSPLYRAQKRLWDLKLDSLLCGLVAWEGYRGEQGIHTDGYVNPAHMRTRTRLQKCIPVPLSACKPNEEHYAIALDAFGRKRTQSWAIGDSLSKDLMPASNLGLKTIWAKYGAGFDPNDKDTSTLLRITHWDESQIKKTYSMDGFEPDYTINAMDEMMSIIPPMILTLF